MGLPDSPSDAPDSVSSVGRYWLGGTSIASILTEYSIANNKRDVSTGESHQTAEVWR